MHHSGQSATASQAIGLDHKRYAASVHSVAKNYPVSKDQAEKLDKTAVKAEEQIGGKPRSGAVSAASTKPYTRCDGIENKKVRTLSDVESHHIARACARA